MFGRLENVICFPPGEPKAGSSPAAGIAEKLKPNNKHKKQEVHNE